MLLRLTGLQGDAVYVAGEDMIFHHAPAGTAASKDCTIIQTSAGMVYVKESVAEVAKLIENSR